MRVSEDFDLKSHTFLEDGTPEYLEWIPLDTEKTIYPEFFKTELRNRAKETQTVYPLDRHHIIWMPVLFYCGKLMRASNIGVEENLDI